MSNEKMRNNCYCNLNDYYKPAYYSNKPKHVPQPQFHEDCEEIVDCCPPEPECHEKPEKDPKFCNCCKEGLQHAMKLLFTAPFDSYINPATFKLCTPVYSATGASIKNISSCNGDGITFATTPAGPYTFTTFCDLTAFQVTLAEPIATNVPLFAQALQAIYPKYDTKAECCYNKTCCCNPTKASFLAGALSPLNMIVDATAPLSLTSVSVLAVTDDIAIVIDKILGVVTFVCLNALRFIG